MAGRNAVYISIYRQGYFNWLTAKAHGYSPFIKFTNVGIFRIVMSYLIYIYIYSM